MEKPEYVSLPDWKYLCRKYKDNMEYVVDKLNIGYPVQYLIGNVEFLNTIIFVDERVLIPRFETERLVELVIERFKDKKGIKVLDACTGSGCIGISLKKNLNCDVDGFDISLDALNLAKSNALYNKVDVNFFYKDICDGIDTKYDLIISNPPYIKEDGYVDENVLKYEPHLALFAKDNGLYFYKVLIDKYLPYTKAMALEVGDNLYEPLKELLDGLNYEFLNDYQGLVRYLFIYNE